MAFLKITGYNKDDIYDLSQFSGIPYQFSPSDMGLEYIIVENIESEIKFISTKEMKLLDFVKSYGQIKYFYCLKPYDKKVFITYFFIQNE